MIRNSDIHRLRGLFAKRLIATMDMLKKTVGTVADLTVFRKLRELDYCTSYSHRGRFYTLRELAEFDENGLWWIRSVGFSKAKRKTSIRVRYDNLGRIAFRLNMKAIKVRIDVAARPI